MKMLRSVLVTAFSAIVAFGALAGLGVKSGGHETNGVYSVAVAGPGGEPVAVPADSVWD
jgi:hypothetical protein